MERVADRAVLGAQGIAVVRIAVVESHEVVGEVEVVVVVVDKANKHKKHNHHNKQHNKAKHAVKRRERKAKDPYSIATMATSIPETA